MRKKVKPLTCSITTKAKNEEFTGLKILPFDGKFKIVAPDNRVILVNDYYISCCEELAKIKRLFEDVGNGIDTLASGKRTIRLSLLKRLLKFYNKDYDDLSKIQKALFKNDVISERLFAISDLPEYLV